MNKVLICAGEYHQARMLARQMELRMHHWMFINAPYHLQGIPFGTPIYMTGTYWNLPEIGKIDELIDAYHMERRVRPL